MAYKIIQIPFSNFGNLSRWIGQTIPYGMGRKMISFDISKASSRVFSKYHCQKSKKDPKIYSIKKFALTTKTVENKVSRKNVVYAFALK